jgi:hypothetical protein
VGKKLIVRHKATNLSSNDSSDDLALVLAKDSARSPPIGNWRPKPWKTHAGYNHFGFEIAEMNGEMVHAYFSLVAPKMYPLGDILLFNPIRTPSFFERAHSNLVTMHCVAMAGSLLESVVRGRKSSTEMAFYIGKVCNMVNEKLQDRFYRIEPTVLECVVAMATLTVGRLQTMYWQVHNADCQQSIIGKHDH